MSWDPAVIMAAFLAGLAIGRGPLRAIRRELGSTRRELAAERGWADQSAVDAEMWRRRAVNTAARLSAVNAELAPLRHRETCL